MYCHIDDKAYYMRNTQLCNKLMLLAPTVLENLIIISHIPANQSRSKK